MFVYTGYKSHRECYNLKIVREKIGDCVSATSEKDELGGRTGQTPGRQDVMEVHCR